MKRIVLVLLIAALLCACTAATEPVVEIDTRAEQTPIPVEEDTIGVDATEAPDAGQPAEAPVVTEAPVETEAPEEASFVERVIAAWEAEGLLTGLAPYSEPDILDLYGIDLSAGVDGAGFSDAVSYVKEVLLIETDEAAAKEIEDQLRNHIEQVKETFRSYDAEAYAVAENAVLVRDGGVVLMIVSPDAEAMQNVFASVTR